MRLMHTVLDLGMSARKDLMGLFLQNPISNRTVIDAIEHKEIYEQLERPNMDVQESKS